MPTVRSIRHALGYDQSGALDADLVRLGVTTAVAPRPVLTDQDVDLLPSAVQRYLRFTGCVGRPMASSFGARFVGRFRMKPGGRWMPCEAVQLTRIDPVARLFRMRVTLGGCLPVTGLDSYVGGTGAMRADALGLVSVADGHGPEFDLGELTTWVNDAVLYAPSLLIGPATTWQSDDDHRFEVTFTDHDLTTRSVVTIDERGAPTDVASDDRWAALPDGLVRTTWRTPVARWSSGRSPLPLGASAVWDLPDGPFTYVDGALDPDSIEIDGIPRPR
jgi:hypothetical protein